VSRHHFYRHASYVAHSPPSVAQQPAQSGKDYPRKQSARGAVFELFKNAVELLSLHLNTAARKDDGEQRTHGPAPPPAPCADPNIPAPPHD
jgi:hypothetical protein